jgi:hypothetical protein
MIDYLPEIVALIKHQSKKELKDSLLLIETISMEIPEGFKVYIPELIPLILPLLSLNHQYHHNSEHSSEVMTSVFKMFVNEEEKK